MNIDSSGVRKRFIEKATEEIIAQYGPTLAALHHGDMGHQITWPDPNTMECSCGLRVTRKTDK